MTHRARPRRHTKTSILLTGGAWVAAAALAQVPWLLIRCLCWHSHLPSPQDDSLGNGSAP